MDEKVINNLFVTGNDVEIAIDKLNDTLLDLEATRKSIDDFEKILREKLLNCMLKRYDSFNTKSISLKNYTISLVLGNSKEDFDKDKFLDNEDLEIISLCTEINEVNNFDTTSFKNDYPELFSKYNQVTTDFTVDTKKLSKIRPDIYQKYITILPSTKKPTIMIKSNKDK